MSSLSRSCEPVELQGLASIMRQAFGGDNLSQITAGLTDRLQANYSDAGALLDLSIVAQLNAKPELALQLQSQALQLSQHYRVKSNAETRRSSSATSPGLKVLAIVGPGEIMANTPIEFLLEQSQVNLELLFLGEGLPAPLEIPDHDVAFVAVCQSDASAQMLVLLDDVMKHWPRPFLNAPGCIAQLSRDNVSTKLTHIDGVITSDAHRLRRDEIADIAATACDLFPLIVRPVNSHAGQGLSKLDDGASALTYLSTHHESEFFVAPFIDYRSSDGLYRKARVCVVDGQPLAAHMAISHHWMVHYLNAEMLHSQQNRDEEARFMATFEDQFATKHQSALQEIDQRLGLDYYALDCAESQDGRLVVFEIDSGAVVHSMDPVAIFPYKLPQMQRIFAAFEKMLVRTARGVPRTLPFPIAAETDQTTAKPMSRFA